MNDPLEIDAPYRRATFRAMSFAAAFALVCGILAALSWAGIIGKSQDAQMLLLMALGGIVLFIIIRLVIRLFLG